MRVTLCPGTRLDIKVQGWETTTWPSLHTIPQRPQSHPSLHPLFCSSYFPFSSNSPATSSHLPSLLPSALYQPLLLPPEPAIVSPSHLHSTLAMSLLAASHWDHMAAEVWRLSQWSVAHKDVHTPHRYCLLLLPPLNNSLSRLFPFLPDH